MLARSRRALLSFSPSLSGLVNRAIFSSSHTSKQPEQKQQIQSCGFSSIVHPKAPNSVTNSQSDFFVPFSEKAQENRHFNAHLLRFVESYRQYGHLKAKLDPLNFKDSFCPPQLALQYHGFSEKQLNDQFDLDGIVYMRGRDRASLKEIIDHLEKTYCSFIGVEVAHLPPAQQEWWFQHLELNLPYLTTVSSPSSFNASMSSLSTTTFPYQVDMSLASFTPAQFKNAFNLLLQGEMFDQFLGIKFGSFKRYGGEGQEMILPFLNEIFGCFQHQNMSELILGMPHRGRFNILCSLLNLPPRVLFSKIQGKSLIPEDELHAFENEFLCDVASHIATSVTKNFLPSVTASSSSSSSQTSSALHVSFMHNPSHLEAVNPVAQGNAKAKQLLRQQELLAGKVSSDPSVEESVQQQIGCLLLHGDAAFSGQGICWETLQASKLKGFEVGGVVHVIVNNQVGYTTTPERSRSSLYASDIAKPAQVPILHVNNEEMEYSLVAARLASAFRSYFRHDVLVDAIAWRKWGHNEVDEPSFTQPVMYNNYIRKHQSVVEKYKQQLMASGLLNEAGFISLQAKLKAFLEKELAESKTWKPTLALSTPSSAPLPYTHPLAFGGRWKDFVPKQPQLPKSIPSGISAPRLVEAGLASVYLPESQNFLVHSRLMKSHFEPRKQIFANPKMDEANIDWATAEALAFGSLLQEQQNIRLVGQDVERGTFSQRHAVVWNQTTNERWVCFDEAMKDGKLSVQDKNKRLPFTSFVSSHLSEEAVVAHEYGFSLADPYTLTIWEAQFGDFFNTAQSVFDCFVVGSYSKWLRQNGLVMLLPHEYQGTGPEHSSCRLERALLMTNDHPHQTEMITINPLTQKQVMNRSNNLQIVNPSTPSQYFHVLRRQQLQQHRTPLFVVAPKTLLRLNSCLSPLSNFIEGTCFQPVFDDIRIVPVSQQNQSSPLKLSQEQQKLVDQVQTVVLCSGKIFYDLEDLRSKEQHNDVAILRIEEFAPFPMEALQAIISKYTKAKKVIWCQEEPQNAGAYLYVQPRLQALLRKMGKNFTGQIEYVGRAPLATPATGYGVHHKQQESQIFTQLKQIWKQ